MSHRPQPRIRPTERANGKLGRRSVGIGLGILLIALLVASASSHSGSSSASNGYYNALAEDIMTPPPPFSEDIFPCSECHDPEDEVDLQPRKLEEHVEIQKGLHHGPKDRWCLDCHNPTDRDKLRLANGKLVEFTESYKLCGQCHGPKLRDWRAGVHGKRTGMWDGEKKYLLCAHCHNPHSPKFKPIAPLPPPMRPKEITQ